MIQDRSIYVWFDNDEVSAPVFMGILSSSHIRGNEVFSFEFDRSWLEDRRFRSFDPDLQLFSGRQYPSQTKSNFGIFLDSAPDRWGRVLLDRKEAVSAREENRPARNLFESDYLLGVFDASRMGALRYKLEPDGEFLDNDPAFSTPPWTSIGELENASLCLENEDDIQHNRWIRMLVAPGSSLGGARPKANVVDNGGHLWIAKFPSRKDRTDVGAWEAVCMELARRSGIKVSDWKIDRYNSRYHTFLTKRFDRTDSGKRHHFTSAMTLLGYTDGQEGASYLDIAEWIESNCENVRDNMLELYRRIVFNVAVSNCDDHLRNHGFIYSREGWTLSPAYDLTPDPQGMGLNLNIDQKNNSLDFSLVYDVAPYLGIEGKDAGEIISKIKGVVSDWRRVASGYGISKIEQDIMSAAFRNADR